ncbi:MAG: carboxypeptidase-like regulatory domain-containing protein [Actinobacteria bacterium]|nr:carboxypeptidase-like regulatory domain-containing protein [Actinomycetota bacterium]
MITGAVTDRRAVVTRFGIDAQMALAGQISGSVSYARGQPLAAFVWAYHPDGTVAGMAGSDGRSYTIPNLAAGSYLVYFTALHAPWSAF